VQQPWPELEDKQLFTFAVSPGNPQHVFFGLDKGLYWSQDGGMTLSPRGLGTDFSIGSIAFDSNNPQTILVVAESNQKVSLYRSDDEGATWSIVSDIQGVYGLNQPAPRASQYPQTTLLIDPRNTSTLYLALGRVLKSSDGGISWQDLTLGMSPDEGITSMAMTATNPPILYAAGRSGIWKLTLENPSP
jgi:hypothetical protein